MVFPAILAVVPAAKVIAVKVATAFGLAAAKKAGERIGGSNSRRTANNNDDLLSELGAANMRAAKAETRAAAAEERADAADIVAAEQRYLRLLLVRRVFPIAVLLALGVGLLTGWLFIPGP